MRYSGVWVPLVTPFSDYSIDFRSWERVIEKLLVSGVSGLVVAATTGESLSLSEDEHLNLAQQSCRIVGNRAPVLVGARYADTRNTTDFIKKCEKIGVNGVLCPPPYYLRPDARGIRTHFQAVAACTSMDIILYNIPSRTGVLLTNEIIRELAETKNIVGLKDCCNNFSQSMDLLLNPPQNFSILTGEDCTFYPLLTLGANGGILASAHHRTEMFVSIWNYIQKNDCQHALQIWKKILPFVSKIFEEPNPSPIKYVLQKTGTIASQEVRLPLLPPSQGLKNQLDCYIP